jgi:hypothetical protein
LEFERDCAVDAEGVGSERVGVDLLEEVSDLDVEGGAWDGRDPDFFQLGNGQAF